MDGSRSPVWNTTGYRRFQDDMRARVTDSEKTGPICSCPMVRQRTTYFYYVDLSRQKQQQMLDPNTTKIT